MSRSRRSDDPAGPPLGRRDLLGALAGAALLGCKPKKDPYDVRKPALRDGRGWRAGEERWVLSTCALCDAGCGIKVRVVEGRAVKIEGNPEHPVNRGGLCSRGQAGLQLLYHAERVRSPLRRAGARGAGKWEPISWSEAIGEVVVKLQRLRDTGRPPQLVLVDGESTGFASELWSRFLLSFGSPNQIAIQSSQAGVDLAAKYMQGGRPAFDLENTRFVLAMGAEWLESSAQALRFWRTAAGEEGRSMRVVCVSPRRPRCPVDEWITITPGSTGALALSLAQVLMRDNLIDKDFVRDHLLDHVSNLVVGQVPPQVGKRMQQPWLELLKAEYPPDKTAPMTGVPVATVERLAHELAARQPAVVVNAGDATAASNGLASAMAVLALNALLGNVEREGGMLVQREAQLADWEAMERDEISRWGLMAPRLDGVGTPDCPLGRHRVQAVPTAITAERPYSVQVLLLRKTDPLAELPGRPAWTAALQKVPFVVSFSSLLDQTTQFADLVLPESMPLEAWDVVTPAPATGEPCLGFRQPVVSPVHDTRPAGQIVLALAAGMGGSIGRTLPWKTYEEAVAVRLQGLLVASDDDDGPEDVKSLFADMKEKGGWWNDPAKAAPRTPVLATRSSKFQWTSLGIMFRLKNIHPEKVGMDWPCVGLPPWEPARVAGAPSEFPFQLFPYRPASFVERGMGFLPWLGELPGLSGAPWSDHAEIHPGDAARLGLVDGDRVLIESLAGSCEAVAQISDRVCAGVVAMALGKGGVLNLVVPDEDSLTGLLAWQGTQVRLRKPL